MGEIGRNMTVIEYDGRLVVIDCGWMFPERDMLGIDGAIPDFTYLRDHADGVVGLLLTHGHEDHIGAIPYLLRDIQLPIFATPLTRGLVEVKLKEHKLLGQADLRTIPRTPAFTWGRSWSKRSPSATPSPTQSATP